MLLKWKQEEAGGIACPSKLRETPKMLNILRTFSRYSTKSDSAKSFSPVILHPSATFPSLIVMLALIVTLFQDLVFVLIIILGCQ